MNIFIVEDDPASLELTEIALREAYGLEAIGSASDGEDAWNRLSAMVTPPDVILLDWNLPRVHGESLLGRIRAHQVLAKTPTIVVTTSISSDDNDSAEEGGADDYVVKLPDFDAFQESLTNAINRVLARR